MVNLTFDGLSILEDYSKIHQNYIIFASNKKEFGESLKWKFPNSWGASVVATSHTQWRPQLIILNYPDEGDNHGNIICAPNITETLNGVIEQITVAELVIVLAKIQGLVVSNVRL
jgi:hypothetical protein|tara:strand:- start:7325 stop:7669 length:345 start_codon:yes stop_codon:yes gene_type:complete